MAARREGGGQENQMTPFEVTKLFISLYVDETKLGAVTVYEWREEGQSVSRKALQAGKVVHRLELTF